MGVTSADVLLNPNALEDFEMSEDEKKEKGWKSFTKRVGGRTFVCGKYEGRVLVTPALIGSLENVPIVEIAGGESHFIGLTQAGKVYTWGNGENGRLGHGNTAPVRTPQLLVALAEENIVSISAAVHSSGAVNDKGSVFVWGQTCITRDMQPTSVFTPTRLTFLKEFKFTQISCGDYHVGAITSGGEVWTWGWDRAYMHKPGIIEKLSGKLVTSICSSRDHICILTASREVYTLVFKLKHLEIPSSISQLADLLGESNLNSKREVGLYHENLPLPAIQIACNINNLLVRLENGTVALIDLTSSNLKTNVEALPQFSPDPIADISCGYNHLAALSDSGVLYTWGHGNYGALGHSNTEYKKIGTPITTLDSVFIQRVLCTSFCTFIIDDFWGALIFKTNVGETQVTPKLMDHLVQSTKEQVITSVRMAFKRYKMHARKSTFFSFVVRSRIPIIDIQPLSLEFGLNGRKCPLRKKVSDTIVLLNHGGSDIHVSITLKTASNTFNFRVEPASGILPAGGRKEFDVLLLAMFPTLVNAVLKITINDNYHFFIITKIQTESVVHSDLEINFQEIELGKQISESQFPVYRARWHGVEVAVKVFSYYYIEELFTTFKKEIEIMSTIRHPNILSLLGACTHPLCIVTELMAGSVYDVIHDKSKTIDAQLTYRWMVEIATGMKYLHSRNIIHRDLKSPNLLVSHANQIKICDFGQSRQLSTKMTSRVGTILWMAPENLRGDAYSLSSDVYSYGIIIWELLTRKMPYEEMASSEQIFREITVNKTRPKFPENAPPVLVRLSIACWDQVPEKRPSFTTIVEILKELESTFSSQ
eukprot:TRINITY_DN3402_c0_g1_i3.p1 TRINITY_DN3402_c0_g1~~TRINITY_DN3402_c0_g1_i3.p1  ORF type:complete len:821 (+),score=124.66 TRINITY_DN3402_c0_g1_i3:579-3041(+)